MTRDGALRDIIREAQATRRTQAGTNRVLRAFTTLGLSKQEATNTLSELAIPVCDPLAQAWLAKAK